MDLKVKVGYSPTMHIHTAHVTCRFDSLISKIDKRTGKVIETEPAVLKAGDAAMVRLKP